MSYLFVIVFRQRFLPARLSSCRSGRFLKEPQQLVEKPVRPLLGEVASIRGRPQIPSCYWTNGPQVWCV